MKCGFDNQGPNYSTRCRVTGTTLLPPGFGCAPARSLDIENEGIVLFHFSSPGLFEYTGTALSLRLQRSGLAIESSFGDIDCHSYMSDRSSHFVTELGTEREPRAASPLRP